MKLEIELYGEKETITLEKSTYSNNDNLAIVGRTEDGDIWGVLTVNTPQLLPNNMACVDVNNIPNIIEALTKAGIAKKVNNATINPGGYVDYPVMEFNLAKL